MKKYAKILVVVFFGTILLTSAVTVFGGIGVSIQSEKMIIFEPSFAIMDLKNNQDVTEEKKSTLLVDVYRRIQLGALELTKYSIQNQTTYVHFTNPNDQFIYLVVQQNSTETQFIPDAFMEWNPTMDLVVGDANSDGVKDFIFTLDVSNMIDIYLENEDKGVVPRLFIILPTIDTKDLVKG